MKAELQCTGGAYAGGINASWPFAKLTATSSYISLEIRAVAPLVESQYTFPAESVIAVKRLIILPFLAWGIRIEHTVKSYPRRIVFWSLVNPSKVLAGFAEIGFEPRSNNALNATGHKAGPRVS